MQSVRINNNNNTAIRLSHQRTMEFKICEPSKNLHIQSFPLDKGAFHPHDKTGKGVGALNHGC